MMTINMLALMMTMEMIIMMMVMMMMIMIMMVSVASLRARVVEVVSGNNVDVFVVCILAVVFVALKVVSGSRSGPPKRFPYPCCECSWILVSGARAMV